MGYRRSLPLTALATLTETLVAAFKLSEAERIGELRAAFGQLGIERRKQKQPDGARG